MTKYTPRSEINLILANPRGFCAGVDRAVQIVEDTIKKFGAPVYVRHEIVHNRHVIEHLAKRGAVFVDELSEAPNGTSDATPIIFSAHGVAKTIFDEATARAQKVIDATCPLVSKVHNEATRLHADGRHILLIGHAEHPEVVGTMGQLPHGAMTLIETTEDAQTFALPKMASPEWLGYLTQTTLAIDDTAEIIKILKQRFPNISAPPKQDICYATTNRQHAVKKLAISCDLVLVIGAPNSSNAQRLVEVAAQKTRAMLIDEPKDIDWQTIQSGMTIGLTAGASAPETIVQKILNAFQERCKVTLSEQKAPTENVHFKLPAQLR